MSKMTITKGTPRKVKILGMHPDDAFYKNREQYIGLVGMFQPDDHQGRSGYFAGRFYNEIFVSGSTYFLAIRYRRI